MGHFDLQLGGHQRTLVGDADVENRAAVRARGIQLYWDLAVQAVVALGIHPVPGLGADAAVQGGVHFVQAGQRFCRSHGRKQRSVRLGMAVPIERMHAIGPAH